MMKIKEIQEEIVDEFSMFDDWMQHIYHRSRQNLPLIKEEFKTENNLIRMSVKVWLQGEQNTDSSIYCRQ
jgi:cysteine desulfuration protein SufE